MKKTERSLWQKPITRRNNNIRKEKHNQTLKIRWYHLENHEKPLKFTWNQSSETNIRQHYQSRRRNMPMKENYVPPSSQKNRHYNKMKLKTKRKTENVTNLKKNHLIQDTHSKHISIWQNIEKQEKISPLKKNLNMWCDLSEKKITTVNKIYSKHIYISGNI
jgi:hypothetical protein